MKNCLYFTLCLPLFLSSRQSNLSEKIELNERMLLSNLKVISHDSMEGRFFGTKGNYKAQRFISKQFDSLGIVPALAAGHIQNYPYTFKGKFRQRIYPLTKTNKNIGKIPDTTVTGGNVVAMIKGKIDRAIVITAHLDHLGMQNGEIFNGADDDASGVAALLTMANYFSNKLPRHTLIFAAVDAEEIGSQGCAYLLDNFPLDLENIVLNINMDMIAHNDSAELYASGLYHYPNLKQPLDEIKSTNIKLLYGHDDPNNENIQDWTFASDHRIFHQKGIPFIYFGVEDHKDYHKPTDTFENINAAFYVDAVKLIIEAIARYDQFLSND